MNVETAKVRVLVVDDEPIMGDFLKELLGRRGYYVDVSANGRNGISHMRDRNYDLVFADTRMRAADGHSFLRVAREISPMSRVVVMTAVATVENTIQAMRLGASDCLTKPLRSEQVEEILDRLLGEGTGAADAVSPKREVRAARLLIGESRQLREIHSLIDLAATTDATVLICGETGTGKELVARSIHRQSARRNGRFIRLNCAALPESLYESELFGHERGAFTGAVQQKKGRFENANGGTLLMDEISEIGWGVQAKLLRVLQEKEFERIGGCQTIRADARIIAVTNKDLAREIREERFRSDLYYRLSVFPITVPPLRERPEDILPLVDHFLALHCNRNSLPPKRVSRNARELLLQYQWPGNVRQLENCLERATLVSVGSSIGKEHFAELTAPIDGGTAMTPAPHIPPAPTSLRDMETDLMLRILEEEGGNRTRAASRLGITTRTLRNKLHRIGRMDFLKKGGRGKKVPVRQERRAEIPSHMNDEKTPPVRSNPMRDRELEHVGADGPKFAPYSGQHRGGNTDDRNWGAKS